MKKGGRAFVLLVAEDDDDDFLLFKEALDGTSGFGQVRRVRSGRELLHYLRRTDGYAEPVSSPRPHLILLDINMPAMNGQDALREIKRDQKLRAIPVVAMTNSSAEEDVALAYQLGVNSYLRKPASLSTLSELVRLLERYWLTSSELPPD